MAAEGIRNTKLALKRMLIAKAVNDLCKDRPLDEISIDDICERADISRSSFYRAFTSKYDVAIWCQTFPLVEGIGNMGRAYTCREGLTISFEGLAVFKELILASKGSPEMEVCDEESRQLIVDMLTETFETFHPDDLNEDIAFQIEWIDVAGMAIARDWMSGKIAKSPSEIARLIEESYPPRLREILNCPAEPATGASSDLGSVLSLALRGVWGAL